MKNTFLLLFAACVSQVLSLDERGCKGLMELIITIDGSDSINEPDYISLRESMGRLVQSLDIRESEIRLSFVVFSSGIAFRRNLTGDKNQLLIDAQHLPHPRDGTKTFEAIEVMRNIASKRRKGVPVIGLVLTDGISKNITKTTRQAFLIKQENVTMYAIGISRIKNFTELRNIASGRDKVLYYKSFQELAEKLSSLVKLVCPKCPPNPLLRNSDTVQGSYIVEDTLSYHCKPDFVAVGNNTITCQRDQTWTKLDYACLAQCGPPPVIDKTELVLPGNLEGSKTKYKCSKNTVLKGTPETECKEDGTWSDPVFECIPDCGLPGIIPRATLSHGSTLEGTIRTYTCASNTVTQGDPNIVCQKNGQWSKTKVYCRPDCGNPNTIIRAFLNPGGTLEGDTRTYTCNQGTKTEGKTSITCGPDGKWSYTNLYCRPDCGEPMAIDRAELVRFQIIEGVKHLLDTLEGTRREYRCRENTVQEGDNKILCSSKGVWIRNGPPLYCRPDCGNPPVIQRSKVTYTGTLENQIATYTCDRNTVTEGETQIVCQQDGYWSTTSLYCRPDCGEPKIIERATISKGNNLEGTRRRYTCNPKTVSEGITEILCGKNGRWSDIDLYCRRKSSSSSESSEENGTKDDKSDSGEKGDNSSDDSDDNKKSNGSDDNSTDKSNDKSVKSYENNSKENSNDDSSDKHKNNNKNSSSKNKSNESSDSGNSDNNSNSAENGDESKDKNTKNTNKSSAKNRSSDSSDKSESNSHDKINVSNNNSGNSGSTESDDSSSNDDAHSKSYIDRNKNNDSDDKSVEKNDSESDGNSDDQYNGDKGSNDNNGNSREGKYKYNIQSRNTNSNSDENSDDSNDNNKRKDNKNDGNYRQHYLKTRNTSDESDENSDRRSEDNLRESMQPGTSSEGDLDENLSDAGKSSESKEALNNDDLMYVKDELKGIDNAVENSVKQLKDDLPDSYESTEEGLHENNENSDENVNDKRILPGNDHNYARKLKNNLIYRTSKQKNYQGNDNRISLDNIVQAELSKLTAEKNEKNLQEEWEEFLSDGWLIDLSNFLSHEDNYNDDSSEENLDYDQILNNKETHTHEKNIEVKNNEKKSNHVNDNEENDDIESDANVDYLDLIKKEIQGKRDHSEKKHDSSESDSYESEEKLSTLNGQPETLKRQPQNENEEPDIEGDDDYDYMDAILKSSGKLNSDSKEASNQLLKDSEENSHSDESDKPFDDNFHQMKKGTYHQKMKKSSNMSSKGSNEESSSDSKSGESNSYKRKTGNEGSNSDENARSSSESSNEKQEHVSLKKSKDDELNNSIRKLDDINAYLNYNGHQSKKVISDKNLKKSHGFTHELDEPTAKEHINLLHSILLKSNVDNNNEHIKNGLDEKD